ncbi:hypothetical protein [Streptomyces sp. NPDC094049]|uniref:hypothetical protein n=1 Tax=Streptomyces sp. NPDC094049 TaxID=3154987 RepID=UPI00331C0A13
MTVRAHRAGRGLRTEGALAHLLLVVVLALGVFLMHVVGHPEGSGGDTASGTGAVSSEVSGAGTHGSSETVTVGASGTAAASAIMVTDSAAAPDGSHHGGGSDARHEPGSGMDMTTLCVAVLAGWLLSGLVRAALVRRPDWLTLLLARLVPALGPHAPPPRPPDLTRLSVLRI